MKRKIGAVLVSEPCYGGVFQYDLSIVNAMAFLDENLYDITTFYRHKDWAKYIEKANRSGYRWVRYSHRLNIPLRALGRMLRILDRGKKTSFAYKFFDPLYYYIKSANIDLAIYPYAITYAFEIGKPYIVAVHDLQHRMNPDFPEVSMHGEWERREYLYKNVCENADAILVDSRVGKEDVLKFYEVKPERVHILPFVPPSYLNTTCTVDIKRKYHLPDKFIFYPAQFWQHKNHIGLLEALSILRKNKGLNIPAVFVGSKRNAYKEVKARTSDLGLSDLVFFLGYVSDEDMVGLYKTAHALVMPTFFGPTNIPQLEAFLLGCPVMTSDLRGIREQVGNAAILVNPISVESIAKGIERIWFDEELRNELIQKGHARSASWTQEHFNEAFRSVIDKVFSSFGESLG